MTTETIAALETKLAALQEQIKTTIADPSELRALQQNERGRVAPVQEFWFEGIRSMLAGVKDIFDQGYSFNPGLPMHGVGVGFGSVTAYLKKPADLLEKEYLEKDIETEENYMAKINATRESLLEEMAQTAVDLASARVKAKEKDQQKTLFDKELEKVRKAFPAADAEKAEPVQSKGASE